MKHKNKKYDLNKIFFHPIFVSVIGLCLLIYVMVPVVRNAQKQRKINSEIKELEREITELDGNNSDLKKMINYLNSDQFVLEQARLNLNYKKNEEEVAVIKSLENTSDVKREKQIFSINKRKEEKSDFVKGSNVYKWWLFFVKNYI